MSAEEQKTAPGEPAAASVQPGVTVEASALSDVGCIRERNEDAFVVADLTAGRRGLIAEVERHEVGEKGTLFVVCDGMGGAAAGDYASNLAADVMYREMAEAPPARGDRAVLARLIRRAVRSANRRVWDESRLSVAHRGMGTTLSAAAIERDALILAQVGDSRAYLYRMGVLTQVTRDQSVVSALLNAGRLTPEEARSFAHSNVILQALGVADDVDVSLSVVELRRGDLLLLCSDGLHGTIGDEGIRQALAAAPALGDACRDLIARARAAGGPDNITAVLARFEGAALPEIGGTEDLPRFVEFDPAEEGERSLTTTSRVARRLAARAGVGDEPAGRSLPATGQHSAVSEEEVRRAARRSLGAIPVVGSGTEFGPATAAVAQKSRLGPIAWLLAAIAVLALVGLFFWDSLG